MPYLAVTGKGRESPVKKQRQGRQGSCYGAMLQAARGLRARSRREESCRRQPVPSKLVSMTLVQRYT